MGLYDRRQSNTATLLASAERDTTSAGTSGVHIPDVLNALVLMLDVTAIDGSGVSLDVWVQTTIDGSTWFDIAQFTQVLTDTKQYILKIPAVDIGDGNSEPVEFEASTALALAKSYRAIFGNQYRTRYTIVGDGHTFSVSALAM